MVVEVVAAARVVVELGVARLRRARGAESRVWRCAVTDCTERAVGMHAWAWARGGRALIEASESLTPTSRQFMSSAHTSRGSWAAVQLPISSLARCSV